MVDRLLLAQIQHLRGALDANLRADAGPARPSELPWQPGQRVTATVEALRGQERALLRIGDLVFDTPAPAGAAPGQKLDLVFVSASPRITFALPGGNVAQAAQQPADPSRQVDISGAARRLDALVAALTAEDEAAPAAAKDIKPLIPGVPVDPKSLAGALREHVARSGMFYESHLEHWAEGRLPLERIRQEPQGRLAPAVPPGDEPSRAQTLQAADAGEPVSPLAAGDKVRPQDAVHPAALPQVRAQLEALQTGQIAWQGQVWPGQDLQIAIEEDGYAHAQDAERVWTSRLRLELPRLGNVEAVLQLSGQHLRVRLSADQPASVEALEQARGRLAEQLNGARFQLVELDVDATR